MSNSEDDPLVGALESIGKHMGEIKAGIEATRSELAELAKSDDSKTLSSLDLRMRQLLGAVEQLPSKTVGQQSRGNELAGLEEEIQSLTEATVRATKTRTKKTWTLWSVGFVMLVVFLAGGVGGILLNKWLVASDPQVQTNQAVNSQLSIGSLYVNRWLEMNDKEKELMNRWLSGSIKLPVDPNCRAPNGSPTPAGKSKKGRAAKPAR